MRTIFAGKVYISDKYILDCLKFHGGKIHYIGWSENKLGIAVVIEHPDMPRIHEGDMIPEVTVSVYTPDNIIRIEPETKILTRIRCAIQVLRGK